MGGLGISLGDEHYQKPCACLIFLNQGIPGSTKVGFSLIFFINESI